MKFTTYVAESRGQMNHSLAQLRVQKPLYYKILSVLLIIIGVGGIVAAYFLFTAKDDHSVVANQFNIPIKIYSLNGEVLSIEGNKIALKAALVQSQNGNNKSVYENKTITINASTPVMKVKIIDGKLARSSISSQEIRAGTILTVYTSMDPNSSAEISGNSLEVVEQ